MNLLPSLLLLVGLLATTVSHCSALRVGGFSLPQEWAPLPQKPQADRQLTLKLALTPRDGPLLEKTLLEVSVPGSRKFRQYLTKSQITALVGRSDADIARVEKWLNDAGAKIAEVHPHRDWLIVSATVAQVESLFECELVSVLNKRLSTTRLVAPGGYSIADHVSDVVQMVAGLTSVNSGRWSAPLTDDAAATSEVTPQVIYDTYQSPNDGTHGSKLGSQCVVEFGRTANFNEDDTQTFFNQFMPALSGETCGMAYGDNNGDVRPSVEANLDVQYIMAAGTFINTTDYKLTSNEGIEDQFLDYTILVNSQNDPPLVHSISYGEYGGSYDNATDQRFSYELQKMGISGISVLLASGDNGVGCNTQGTSQEFDYPSSPYITMVGATYIDAKTKKEVGATLSSGGFSKDFMQASWQADAVNAYLNSGVKMPSEDFYAPGRAYPDVAAFGQNVQVVASGKAEAVSGTSCSAPILGGLIASLNHELMSAGKAPLGFLNPWLYANPQMFTDVTEGSNPYQKCDGFLAAPGWDPVTGMGTPLYPQMKVAAFKDV